MNKDIWFRDPKSFFSYENILKFFPAGHTSKVEQLNSLFRFSLYLSLLIYVYNKNEKVFLIPLFTGVFTFIEYDVYSKTLEKESFRDQVVGRESERHPTFQNPFMNPNLITEQQPDAAAENIFEKKTRDSIQKFFEAHKDIETAHLSPPTLVASKDLLARSSEGRDFYTVPSTTIPSDQDSFATFLYGDMKSSKRVNIY